MGNIPHNEDDVVYPKPMRFATVEGGKIRGIRGNNPEYTVFKGIPYAAPPVGNLRWKRPQSVIPWEGVRDCIEFAPECVQFRRRNAKTNAWVRDFCRYEAPQSEDCLYLNVWTPASTGEEKLPVLVWIHGGAYANGSGSEVQDDGEGYCRRGCVFVSINYRLHALGYFAHPDLAAEDPDGLTGNYGLYDQIAALTWVQNNIAAFGGDPSRVTIMGQSAGAGACLALMQSPLTKGLFHRVIVESGIITGDGWNCCPPTQKEGEEYGVKFMEEMGCKSLEELRQLPAEEMTVDEGMMNGRPFLPVLDGKVLVDQFREILSAGKNWDVDIMMGNTVDERSVPGPSFIFEDVRLLGRMQAALGRKGLWAYCFSRRWPGPDWPGAIHGAEHWYQFETLYRSWRPFTGVDFDVARKMCDFIANYVKTGDPNGPDLPIWTRYDDNDPKCMEIGEHIGMISANRPYPR